MSTGIQAHFALTRGAFSLDAAFDVAGRGVTAIFGPSGSGKTTLLRCMAGLERAPSGRCVVNGIVWQDEAEALFLPAHRRPVGYVFQEASLFSHLTVRGNLMYGWKRISAGRRRIDFDAAVGLLGLDRLLHRTPDALSGGERQRVAVARALLTSPDLLLADEPLAGLDTASKVEILPYLQRLSDEMHLPCLYVSHSLEEVARLADGMILITDGRVIGSGPIEQMISRSDVAQVQGDEAGALIRTSVASHDDASQLTEVQFAGGNLWVPRLAQPPGAPLRVRVLAKDVSIALTRPTDTSILNIVPVRVVDLTEDGPGQVLIRLDAAGVKLLARITRRSASQLHLRPDLSCFAQVKSVALLA